MVALVALFVADVVLVGAGLTYLSGLDLRLEERVGYGVVIGAMTLTLTGLATGWVLGFDGVSVGVGAAISTLLSLPGWWRGRDRIAAEARDFVARRPYELLLLVPTWFVAVRILNVAYTTDEEGALLAGHLSTWTDWQAHLTYAGSFAYSDNFPPELPTAAGYDLGYHFGIDFFAAMFVPLGTSLPGALTVSSGVVAFAFPAVMYFAGVRLLDSRLTAGVAVALFTVFGGLGWVEFVRDANNGGIGIITDLPNDYTRYQDQNYWVENPVTGVMFPQRPTLVGFSALLAAIVALWLARRQDSIRPWLAAGVLVGVMPLFHLFSYGTALGLGIIWALLDRRREWLWYLVPAVVLSLPVALWLLPPERGWELGLWVTESRGGRGENILWFWFKNMGLFLPLLLVAQLWRGVVPRVIAIASLPIWLWLIVPNVIVPVHASDFNNTHFFVFVLLIGAFPVAALLVRVARLSPVGAGFAVLAFLTMTFAGALDIWKAADRESGVFPLQAMSGPAVETADWVRDNTDNDALFVAAPSHLQSVSALGGKQLVMGFGGWVFDLGIPDWAERRADTEVILQGGAAADELLERYGVDYVHIGPLERDDFAASDAYWEQRATIVYDADGHRVYDVRG